MIKTHKVLAGILFLLTLSANIFGQDATKADAVASFNAAAEILKTDTIKAIKAFEDLYAVCEKVGTEADSLKAIAAKIIPSLYFDQASKKAQAKLYAEAAAAYEEVATISKKYGDEATATKATNNLPQLYFGAGLTAYNQKSDAEALKNLEKTITLDPAYTKAYYLSAAIYRRMDNKAKFGELVDKTLEVSKSNNDKKTEDDALKLAKAYYQNNYIKATKANKNAEAAENLKSALKYSPDDKDLTFFLGQTYGKLNQFDLAVENINKALALETGGDDAKAKYYFELGNIYKAKKDNTNACESYKKAQFGKYLESAKYEITVTLKCK